MSLAVVGICACGGPKTTSLTPSPSEEVIKKIPEWYLQPPEDSKHLYATGAATSRDLQISVQKAKMSAQADLSQQISTRFGNLSKQFQEETGQEEDSELLTQFSAAAKAVSQETLVGSKVEKKEILPEKQIYRAYVLMSLPLGEANQRLMQKIKADQNLYTKLRATEAYKELDRELEALK
jgi:hypothetical protein